MFFISTTSTSTRGIAILLIALILGVLYAPRVYAIGISPPIIPVVGMLRNSVQTHSVAILVQDPAPHDIVYTVTPRGEYSHYIKGPSEHIIPKGKTSALYTFDIEPIDAAVGSYEILLSFTEKAEVANDAEAKNGSGSGAKVSVLQGATAVITLSISGEEKVSFNVLYGTVEDTELRIPLIGTYTVNNTGNVEWKPDSIELTVTDVKDAGNTTSFTIDGGDIPSVKPLKTDTSSFSVGHKLIEGKYKGHMKFLYKGQIVAEFDTPPFNIFAPGTLNQSGEIISVTTNKEVYTLGEQVVLKAVFKNTGDITVEANIETKIYMGEDFKNLEVSRKLGVERKQEIEFQQFIKLNEPGEYTFEVTAEFGNRRSDTKSISVTVEAKGVSAIAVSLKDSLAILGFVIIIIFFLLFVYLRHKKKLAEIKGIGGVSVIPVAGTPVQPIPVIPVIPVTPVIPVIPMTPAVPITPTSPTPTSTLPAPMPIAVALVATTPEPVAPTPSLPQEVVPVTPPAVKYGPDTGVAE